MTEPLFVLNPEPTLRAVLLSTPRHVAVYHQDPWFHQQIDRAVAELRDLVDVLAMEADRRVAHRIVQQRAAERGGEVPGPLVPLVDVTPALVRLAQALGHPQGADNPSDPVGTRPDPENSPSGALEADPGPVGVAHGPGLPLLADAECPFCGHAPHSDRPCEVEVVCEPIPNHTHTCACSYPDSEVPAP